MVNLSLPIRNQTTESGQQQWQFWIDRGSTFTDIVAQRPDGSVAVHKP
jgi:5-oxoprolinase (ATP-hydrolysing)